jgi:hypothetical protein
MHVLEDFFQMWAYILHFLGLRKNLQKIILRQEIETSKDCTLLFNIVLNTSLNLLKVVVHLSESIKKWNLIFQLLTTG